MYATSVLNGSIRSLLLTTVLLGIHLNTCGLLEQSLRYLVDF